MRIVAVTGSFDNLRSKTVRFLEETSKWGDLHVGLWSDETAQAMGGKSPRFPERERLYLLQALRYVHQVRVIRGIVDSNVLSGIEALRPDIWLVDEASNTPTRRAQAEARGIAYGVIGEEELRRFPAPPFPPPLSDPGPKRVLVTGSFDWLHSGHVRFFEEASTLGELYVVVGHDANIKHLKGDGHPLLPQDERLYMVHSVRYVRHAMISTGHGWMDAEPEITAIKPHLYVVNEDGDKPEKRAFCAEHAIEYVVRQRIPKTGLPKRQSADLRGF
jgi:cytidyltransferase-like protein